MTGAFDSRFAGGVTVTDTNGSRTARAFIQPMSVKDPETPALTAAGVSDPRRWLLIMEPTEICGPAEISDGKSVYALLRWEDISGHIEGVLARKGDADRNA